MEKPSDSEIKEGLQAWGPESRQWAALALALLASAGSSALEGQKLRALMFMGGALGVGLCWGWASRWGIRSQGERKARAQASRWAALSLALSLSAAPWLGRGLQDASLIAWPGVMVVASIMGGRKTFAAVATALLAQTMALRLWGPDPGPEPVWGLDALIAMAATAVSVGILGKAMRQARRDLREEIISREAVIEAMRSAEQARRAQESARRRLAALGAQAAGMAHELNTPLGNARVCSSAVEELSRQWELLAQGATVSRAKMRALAERQRQAAEALEIALKAAGSAVESFKASAAERAKDALARGEGGEQVDLKELIERALNAARDRLDGAGVQASARFESGALKVEQARPGDVELIVETLLENAIEHAFEGKESRKVTIKAGRDEQGVTWLKVEDDGVGIQERQLGKIFEPAFKESDGKSGYGLGLALAKEAAERMGARLEVRSARGIGTIFELRWEPLRG